MSPGQMLEAAQMLVERVPDCRLVKNEVGNLAIVRGDEFIGWVDLRSGEVHLDEIEVR